MTEPEEEGAQRAPDPSAMERIFAHNSSDGSDGLQPAALPRDFADVVIPVDICIKGAFPADIMELHIKLQSLSSRQEMAGMKDAEQPAHIAYKWAQLSLAQLNGKPLTKADREVLWEVIGSRGRQRVVAAFGNLAGGGEDEDDEGLGNV